MAERIIDNSFVDPKFDGGIFPGFEGGSATEEIKTIGGVEIVFNPNETVIGTNGEVHGRPVRVVGSPGQGAAKP